jgi:hypothetical protein
MNSRQHTFKFDVINMFMKRSNMLLFMRNYAYILRGKSILALQFWQTF